MNFEEPPEPQPTVPMAEPEAPQTPEPVGEAAPKVEAETINMEQLVILHDKRLERIESFLKEVRTPTESSGLIQGQAGQPMHPLVEMGLKIAGNIADRLAGGSGASPISEEVAKRMMDAFWSSEIRRFQKALGYTEHMVFTAK